ncbi:MAG: M3 family oligoendopeptidase [Candidatus Sumerlaeota bacterium]|nr:M3 family oligoendopeptidase [Candidatus Sumerlaeota bacterium]
MPADPIAVKRGEEFPRRFVPADADCGQWETIEPLLKALLDRAIDSSAALERWLLDQSELKACVAEETSRRYIAMTCATDDEGREKRYLYIVETLQPNAKPYWHRLREKYLACPHRTALDRTRYFVYDRATETESRLYREENILLQTEDDKLAQQYQKICGAMTVQFQGKELTLPQLRPFLEETDRAARETVWRLEAERRLRDRDALDGLYRRMIDLRARIAAHAGFPNFLDYAFPAMERFDYTVEHCRQFHAAIEEAVAPAARAMQEERRKALGLTTLRPWDLVVDVLGRPPLRPFQGGEALWRACLQVFQSINPALGEQFASIAGRGLLDLDSRKGKAPGGYQDTLQETRLPFIFMNAAGTDDDVYTLLHEGGHAFHALAARGEPLIEYRHSPTEFAEVASMGTELLAVGRLRPFYSEADEGRSLRRHLEGILRLLPWVAQIDAFQHWIYTRPDHTTDERRAAWLELDRRFGGVLDWSGWEPWRESLWQRQLHLFECPLYYIEYGIAQLGALQVWNNYAERGAEAVDRLRRAFALGGSRPLPELFEAAGARFDFSAATLQPLVGRLMDTLRRLPV